MPSDNDSFNMIWPYVFDGLSTEQRTEFEAKMAENPELANEVENARKLDHLIQRVAKAGPPMSNDELSEYMAAKLHAEFVHEFEAGTLPEWVHARSPLTKRPLVWQRRIPTLIGIAAVAAVLLVLANVFVMPHGPVQWQRADYGEWPPPNRTVGEPVPVRVYAEQELKDVAAQMAVAVMDAYRVALGVASDSDLGDLKRRWKLRIGFQELKEGDLQIRVVGRCVVPTDTAREWELFVSGREELAQSVPDFALRVGTAMAATEKAEMPMNKERVP